MVTQGGRMADQLYVQECIAQIKKSGIHLCDWALFVDSLKYSLLPVFSRQLRNNLSEYPKNTKFMPGSFCPTFIDKALSAVKLSIAAWQKCRYRWFRNTGKQLFYIRPDDRFFKAYRPYLKDESYIWVTDRLCGSSNYLKYAPIPDMLSDVANAYQYWDCLEQVLQDHKVYLLQEEAERLSFQSLLTVQSIARVRRFFSSYPINGLVLDGDSWLPVNIFSSVAAEENVPVVCIQHGLDCEHWCLDEAFSPYYCVWGHERKKRYEQNSFYQPKEIFVTGNPLLDNFSLPKSLSAGGMGWLLLTRPHTSEKCYEFSRYPNEGVDVLKMVLSEMSNIPGTTLTIKPHPKDNIEPYKSLIYSMALSGRVFISSSLNSSLDCIRKSDVVFCEDSTSGAEAMIFGKPIIHVSACKVGPCMPFVEYGAALPGFDADMLNESVMRLSLGLSCEERSRMNKGQVEFLKDYFGELDGKASHRIASIVRSIF